MGRREIRDGSVGLRRLLITTGARTLYSHTTCAAQTAYNISTGTGIKCIQLRGR